MLGHILSFQFAGFYGGSIGNILAYWEQLGVFTYLLPFLLIFSVVFGILTKTNILGNKKGLNAVISLVIGLLALQFNFVPLFFSEIFPNLGAGLSIILVLLILIGLFLPAGKTSANYLLAGIAAIIFIVVISKSFSNLGYSIYTYGIWDFIYRNLGAITVILIILVAVGAVIGSSGSKKPGQGPQPYVALWQQGQPGG